MGGIFTRRELYELAWSKPITKIAEELGVSGVAVARMCKRHRIPVPGRGYWARIRAGQAVHKPPFLALKDRTLDRIEFVGGYLPP